MDKLDMILEKLDGMDGEINRLNKDMAKVKGRVENIEVALKNEIRSNIMRIVEGHVDLSRDMQTVIKLNSECEILTVKVNMLECELYKMKKKIS